MLFSLIITIILIPFVVSIGSIKEVFPTKISVLNAELSPVFTFYLAFDTSIRANNYLRVLYTNFTEQVGANSCFFGVYPDFPQTKSDCIAPTTETNVIYLKLPANLISSRTYTFVIDLKNKIKMESLSGSLELSTVSSTEKLKLLTYDLNPNFIMIPFVSRTNNLFAMSISYINPQTQSLPNERASFSLSVKINANLPTNNPRIKLIAFYPFIFSVGMTISLENDPKYNTIDIRDKTRLDYKSPGLFSYTIDSPLQITIILAEKVEVGRTFLINVNGFTNPAYPISGYLRAYSFGYGSDIAYEANENNILMKTVQNPIKITISLSNSIPINMKTSVNFYKGGSQYIQVNFTNTQTIQANSYLKYVFGATNNEIIKGSVSIYSLTSYDQNKLIGYSIIGNTLILSNINSIPANSNTMITLRIRFSIIEALFFIIISADLSKTATAPVFYGKSDDFTFHSNGNSILAVAPSLSSSLLSFNLLPSSRDTSLGSILEIYVNKYVVFSGDTPTCTVDGVQITSCVLLKNENYTRIRLNSASTANLFTAVNHPITISGFFLNEISNNQDKNFELYFTLYYDNTETSPRLYFFYPAIVLPIRNSLGLTLSFSNDMAWNDPSIAKSSDLVSIINIVGNKNYFSGTLNPGEKRLITIFAYFSFSSVLGTNAVSYSNFPCGSNIEINCIYLEGDLKSKITTTYFLDWDRVHIFLPDTINDDFHIILPDQFLDIAQPYIYEAYYGVFTSDQKYKYISLCNQLSIGTKTIENDMPSSVQSFNEIKVSGYAAAQISNFQINIKTTAGHSGNDLTQFGAAVILISNWELFTNGISEFTSYTSPLGTQKNAPCTFNFTDKNNLNYVVVYIPLVNTVGALSGGYSIYLKNAFNPFSLDLPDHSLVVTTKTGVLNSYRTFYNYGPNLFSISTVKDFSFGCLDLYEGELNTFCWIYFQVNNRISAKAKIKAQFTGIKFFTNSCDISYGETKQKINNAECLIDSTNFQSLTLTLNNNQNYPSLSYYNISFVGVDINTLGTNSITIDLSIRDTSGNYIMEKISKSVLVASNRKLSINVNSINVEFRNPGSVTTVNLTLVLPRNLYKNEYIQVDLGTDLFEGNTVPNGLQLFLSSTINGLFYDISTFFKEALISIYLNENNGLAAGNYKITLNGMRLPTTDKTNFILVQLLRNFDGNIILKNFLNSTIPFPSLLGTKIPRVTLIQTKYKLEGHVSELIFQVQIGTSYLDSSTVIYINYPKYYAPDLYTDSGFLYCGINNLQVPCQNDKYFPYRLKIYNFPIFLPKDSLFNITVFGITYPKSSEMTNIIYNNESIFFGIDQFKNGSFSEIALVSPPLIKSNPIPFFPVILHNLWLGNNKIRDFSDHIFELSVALIIPFDSIILINFISSYSSLQNLNSVECVISFSDNIIISRELNEQNGLCLVRKQLVKIWLNREIPISTKFNITLKNIPTPRDPVLIDGNRFLISIVNSNESDVISHTSYQTNTARTAIIFNNTQDLLINYDYDIILTPGTYSDLIDIRPMIGGRFVNNLLLKADIQGFRLLPEANLIKLGDFFSLFQIGVDNDIINSVYSFKFQKQDLNFQGTYNNLNKIYMYIVNRPILIVLPESLSVPYGGCNIPFIMKIKQPPFDNIMVTFLFDDKLTYRNVSIDEEYNQFGFFFNSKNKIANLAFCSNNILSYTIKTSYVSVILSGTNSDSYVLSASTINLKFFNVTRNIPEISSSFITVNRTSVSINIQSNSELICIWRIVIYNNNQTFKNYSQLRADLKNNNFSEIRNGQNYFNTDQYEIINYLLLANKTDNRLVISGLQPSTTYSFYAFGINHFKDLAKNYTFLKFTTMELEMISKITVTFNKSLFDIEINRFLCFMVREFETRSDLVVNSDGKSCSYNVNSDSFYFKYIGSTFSLTENTTNLYFIPDLSLETDTALQKINTYFEFNTKIVRQSVLNDAISYSLTNIVTMKLSSQFNKTLFYSSNSPFQIPTLKNISFGVTASKYNVSLLVQNVELTNDGIIYFIMIPYMQTIEDEDFKGEYYNVSIMKTFKKPTGSQIINCKNWNNETADVCFRGVVFGGQKLNFEVRSVQPYYVYKVYYVCSNENPIQPIFKDDQVFETEAISYKLEGDRLIFSYLIAVLILLTEII